MSERNFENSKKRKKKGKKKKKMSVHARIKHPSITESDSTLEGKGMGRRMGFYPETGSIVSRKLGKATE